MGFPKKHPLVVLILVSALVIGPIAESAYASYRYQWSSGPFELPENATRLIVKILNMSQTPQWYQVSVWYYDAFGVLRYQHPGGPLLAPVAPNAIDGGSWPVELPEGRAAVVVVKTDDPNVLPSLAAKDSLEGAIAGTNISTADFLMIEIPQAEVIILDNLPAGQSGGARSFTGTWCKSSAAGYYGTDSLYSCGAGADTYKFTPPIVVDGDYNIYVRWTAATTRSTSVPVFVRHAGGTTQKNFNQRLQSSAWVLHGTYNLLAGAGHYVQITDTNGQACADAVKFEPVP